HFVNGKPTPEYPNPVVAVQVLNHTREQLGACQKPPKHRESRANPTPWMSAGKRA
ncbi:hypothetical protein GOODEAATRI_015717, partial [Goodea atripinnis]